MEHGNHFQTFIFEDIFWKENWHESSLCKDQHIWSRYESTMTKPVLLIHATPTWSLHCRQLRGATAGVETKFWWFLVLSGHGPGHYIGQKQGQWQLQEGRGGRKGVTGQRKREEREKRGAERLPREQRRNKAIALKETEANLRAPWH